MSQLSNNEYMSQLSNNECMGIGIDKNSIYVRLVYGWLIKFPNGVQLFTYNNTDDSYTKTLCLQTIHIPKSQRRKGHCTNMLEILENRSQKEGIDFIVAPFMNYGQEKILLPGILNRRGYENIMLGARYVK